MIKVKSLKKLFTLPFLLLIGFHAPSASACGETTFHLDDYYGVDIVSSYGDGDAYPCTIFFRMDHVFNATEPFVLQAVGYDDKFAPWPWALHTEIYYFPNDYYDVVNCVNFYLINNALDLEGFDPSYETPHVSFCYYPHPDAWPEE